MGFLLKNVLKKEQENLSVLILKLTFKIHYLGIFYNRKKEKN